MRASAQPVDRRGCLPHWPAFTCEVSARLRQAGGNDKPPALFFPWDRRAETLTEEEIEAVGVKIVEKVAKATGGVLRG